MALPSAGPVSGSRGAAFLLVILQLLSSFGVAQPDVLAEEEARKLYRQAVMQLQRSRYDEAAELHLQALALRESTLPPGDLAIADSLMALGGLYRNRGWYVEAEPYLTRGLAIRDAALGPDHPAVAHGLMELARVYRTQDRFAEAEPLARRTLRIMERVHGPNDPRVAEVLNELALNFHNQRRYDEALPY